MDSSIVLEEIKKSVNETDDRLLRMFNALGDQTRFRIFFALCAGNDICVTELARILSVSVPAASQQLKLLEMVGLIVRRRDGQKICYEVNRNEQMVREICLFIDRHN